jgi:hypothetical protein
MDQTSAPEPQTGFKAKVALAAIKGELTLARPAEHFDVLLKVAEGLGRSIDQIPKRDRRTASPLASAQQPMDQFF